MPGTIQNELGTISISEDVAATIAGSTTVESYGVVGMAAQKTGDSIFELLGRENLRKGVAVKFVENACVVDLHIIVEYGVSIGAVAQNVIDNVTYRLRDALGLAVSAVNVHVEGVRIQRS